MSGGAGSSAQILIIEDNDTNLELMVYLLQAFGYKPVIAGDGSDGLAKARALRPDLIICDLHIPKMDGYEVGRQVKGHPELRKIPLIAVTAMAMVGDRDKVLAAGFDGYIPKPIVPETFVPQVEAFLPGPKRAHHPPPAANEPVNCSTKVPKRATVLVVDDSPVNLSLIQSTLGPFGYEVIVASRVAEALDLARRTRVDLILSDLHMPDQSGFEFLRCVQADPEMRGIPFLLFSTSTSGPEDLERALGLGAKTLVCRPIEPQKLLDAVQACLQEQKRA